MPSHPVARAVIAAAGVPLAAPSANVSGRPSPTLAAHVVADLSGRLPLVVDGGACGCGVESTVLDGLRAPPAVLRPGGVACEELARLPGLEGLQVGSGSWVVELVLSVRALNVCQVTSPAPAANNKHPSPPQNIPQLYSREFTDASLEAAPTTPGMKYRHYSPSAPVTLIEPPVTPAVQAGASNGNKQQQQGQESSSWDESQEAAAAAVAAAAAEAAAELVRGGQLRVAVLRTTMAAGTKPGWLSNPPVTSGAVENGGSSGSGGGDADGSSSGGGGGPAGRVFEYCLGPMGRPTDVARALFAGLRDAEGAGADAIVVEGVADAGEGAAVMNRLRKAASAVVQA
jgi:L-threonylcarbamoyladenylate synthase